MHTYLVKTVTVKSGIVREREVRGIAELSKHINGLLGYKPRSPRRELLSVVATSEGLRR